MGSDQSYSKVSASIKGMKLNAVSPRTGPSPYNSKVTIPVERRSSLVRQSRDSSKGSTTGKHRIEALKKSYQTKLPSVNHNIREDSGRSRQIKSLIKVKSNDSFPTLPEADSIIVPNHQDRPPASSRVDDPKTQLLFRETDDERTIIT